MNAQAPMPYDQWVSGVEYAVTTTIAMLEIRRRSMKRPSRARTELDLELAAQKRILRSLSGEHIVHAPAEAAARPTQTCHQRRVQNEVESALLRRYQAQTLKSEHDFLAGASAAVMAVHGDQYPRATDAVPDAWQELALCGGSVLARVSEGAD